MKTAAAIFAGVTAVMTPNSAPGLVPLAGVMQINAGTERTCAVTTGGGAKCWGYNGEGEIGDNSTTNQLIPADVVGLISGVAAIATGNHHSCALTVVGGVKCWGYNPYGELGDNSTTQRRTPVDVVGLTTGVTAITTGGWHTCALTTAGGVKCWGRNDNGAIGDNTSTRRLTPVDVNGLTSGVIAISAGNTHTCALTSGGGAKCWGDNYFGATGDNLPGYFRLTPVDVFGLSSGVTAIAAGRLYTCALTVAGGAKCWGYNYHGELGDNSTTQRLTPVDVIGLTGNVRAIAPGEYQTCALTNVGGVKCWGDNSSGNLGDGTTMNRLTPVDVVGLSSGVTEITTGYAHACALIDGGVKCWGVNFAGGLGDNTTSTRHTPVDVLTTANAPPLIPPGNCTLSANPSAVPASGTVSLAVSCTAGGAPTSFDWSGGFLAGRTTYINNQSGNITGTTTFSVVASNAAGASSRVGVTVTVGVPPGPIGISLVNPLQTALQTRAYSVDPLTVRNSVAASALSADDVSAVVVAVLSNLPNTPVTFSVTPYLPMTAFDRNYLSNPNYARPSPSSVTVSTPDYCDGGCVYLALLRSSSLPSDAGNPPSVDFAVTATQAGTILGPAAIRLQPPPLLLIHGIWSSAKATGFLPLSGGFYDWVFSQYPHNKIGWVNYGQPLAPPLVGSLSQKSFRDKGIQDQFQKSLEKLLRKAAAQGMVARQVDVVGHSMGGLATRYFLKTSPFPSDPVHKLITIGTPHLGTELARRLNDNSTATVLHNSPGLVDDGICTRFLIIPCTLGGIFASQGKHIDTGVQALVPESDDLKALRPSDVYSAIIGQAPNSSSTRDELNILIGGFLTNESVDSILGFAANDTIVPGTSQAAGASSVLTIPELVHTALPALPFTGDTGETASHAVWNQTFTWLTGLQPAARLVVSQAKSKATSSAPPPTFDLAGYTEVAATNVTFSPPTNSILTVGAPLQIVATSATKILSEILLFQNVVDPTDAPLLFASQAPFSIDFTPTRLGSANFVAFALFSDMTYAVIPLSYTLQAGGLPVSLTLGDDPDENLTVGMTVRVSVDAAFSNGPIDVTGIATFTERSGTSSVFSVGPGGAITANGVGDDWLDVSYLGLNTSAHVAVSAPIGAPPPTLNSAASRKTHGAAGTFDLPLGTLPTNPTTEPRQGPGQTIVFTFDKPITAATATITEGTATAGAPTFSGSNVIVGLTGVNNQQYVTIALTNVASSDGGTGGSGSVRLGFLVGDVNQNRVVTLADLGLVNAQLSQTVTAANYLKDVNASGTLTVADKGITNANLTKALPAP